MPAPTIPAANARLASRREVAEGLAILRIALEDGRAPAFEPGQFVQIGRRVRGELGERLVQRAYTLASAPSDPLLEVYVVRVPGGALTPHLIELEVGDPLWVDPRPLGSFTLEGVPSEALVLAVGTGTGLAPYVSMLRTHAGRDRWRRFVLLHGVRTRDELGYRDELERLERDDPRFVYVPCLSREPDGPGLHGRVQAALEPGRFEELAGEPLDPRSAHAFLCGNPRMVADVGALLADRGFTPHTRRRPGTLHAERYW